MRFLEKLFFFLFPLAALTGTPWEKTWQELEKKEFFSIARIFFSITLVGYILHYYTVDRAEGLAPSELWFNYRFGMAAVSLICLAIYVWPKTYQKLKFYRVPAIIAGALFCYFQTRTIIWYPKVPYLYAFAFVLVCVVILRTTTFKSVAVALGYLAISFPTLLESGLSLPMASSAAFFTVAVVIFARTKYGADLNYFILSQKNLQQQKKFIEVNLEFTNQIRAFLPGEIARRLDEYIQVRRMSVVQAIDEVLRPRKQSVACLFSDIRGFTKGSNDLQGFVAKAMLPNVKASTLCIEKYRGIPRKIGDLIFAYYDFDDEDMCIEMAMRSAIELARINSELNDCLPEELRIKRFILLSFGESIIGNLSGYQSSIEITAIGSPVNYLSRVDELTKNPTIKEQLAVGDIIISESMVPSIQKKFPHLALIEVDLPSLNLVVRDFEESKKIFLIRVEDIILKNIHGEMNTGAA